MSSLTDIMTTVQNLVRAISNISLTYQTVQGVQVLNAVSTATLVSTGQGRLVRVSVITAGTTVGTAYDATRALATTDPILTIPNEVGVIEVNSPTNNGIVISPGTGQVVTVIYS